MKVENWKEVRTSEIDFQEHLRNNVKYPPPLGPTERLLFVPLILEIDEIGNLASVVHSKDPAPIFPMSGKYTGETEFVKRAVEVVSTYKGWVPERIHGVYQRTRKRLDIHFFYHEKVFQDEAIVLNPDHRPQYPHPNRSFEYTIQGKYGCDGIAQFLVLVDNTGDLIEPECLSVVGKTNCEMAWHHLLKLGKWKPAQHEGYNVVAQMQMTVYT